MINISTIRKNPEREMVVPRVDASNINPYDPQGPQTGGRSTESGDMVVRRAPPSCRSNPELCSCSRCIANATRIETLERLVEMLEAQISSQDIRPPHMEMERQGRYIDDDEGAPESTIRYVGNFQVGNSRPNHRPEPRVKVNLDVVGTEVFEYSTVLPDSIGCLERDPPWLTSAVKILQDHKQGPGHKITSTVLRPQKWNPNPTQEKSEENQPCREETP